MIHARIEQFLKTLPEPDFFIGKNRAAADEIHDLLRQYVEQGTATIEVTVDVDLLLKVENVLRGGRQKMQWCFSACGASCARTN